MESLLRDILDELRANGGLDEKQLAKIIHKHNKGLGPDVRPYAKKRILPYYLKIKDNQPDLLRDWGVDAGLEKLLIQTLRVKPRRSASGVATITVITKPWKCQSNCLYCPNDVRMPKSYLFDEPACQRAEQNFFDPYLQVVSRVRALTHMGHSTDKIELIILGGTWCEYPESYQIWFVNELFRALNDGEHAEDNATKRRQWYKDHGLHNQRDELAALVEETQHAVNTGSITYNEAVQQLYIDNEIYQNISCEQTAELSELFTQHAINEHAKSRVVGLVMETRPDTITIEKLTLLRLLGCTKVQLGIQSLDEDILQANNRNFNIEGLKQSFALLRLFGFKIHVHFMLNLLGSTQEIDKRDYRRLVSEACFIPDEVKLYPCSLVQGTGLCRHYNNGTWQPYDEQTLVACLATNTTDTPPFTRISRMIRDISAHDIVAGNKKANLRQMVESHIEQNGGTISEIRYREIALSEIPLESLSLEIIPFTTSVSDEYFLQWVNPENKIAGFLRLSLPKAETLDAYSDALPIKPHQAMIREVHVYGKVSGFRSADEGSQHLGLGKQLIECASEIAKEKGYTSLNVISSIGTREYYRGLGFSDAGLYQQRSL